MSTGTLSGQTRALVTGGSGFIGSHLATSLLKDGNQVVVLQKQSSEDSSPSPFEIAAGDICSEEFVFQTLQRFNPTIVYHCAGLSPGRGNGNVAKQMFMTNVVGTVTLMEALRHCAPQCRTIVFSSGAVYLSTPGRPLTEKSLCCPTSEYAASKVALEAAAEAWAQRYGLSIILVRPFNIVGPGEPSRLVCSAIARQIAYAEVGKREAVITVGRVDSKRDFTDIRDVVAACLLLGKNGRPGEAYNICSGQMVSIEEILHRLLALATIPLRIALEKAQESMAKDVDAQCGSPEKLFRETGWKPRIPLDQSLSDLLDWWRGIAREENKS